MQILITGSSLVRTRALTIKRWQFALGAALLAGLLMLISGAIYHFIFLTAAREGWPVMGQLVRLIVREETAQRERFMRENLDAMALRVGEMQAKVVKLEALGERVTGMAGVKTDDLKALPGRKGGGQGGPFVPLTHPSLEQLDDAIDQLDERADIGSDLFTLVESRLFEARLLATLVPSTHPVEGPVGSGFGFRIDPITGRAALHTGLDFPADVGTPILAAAGGIVVVSRAAPGLRQHDRDRPRQRAGHALRPCVEAAGQGGHDGQARAEDRRGRHLRPLDRAAPALRGDVVGRAAEPDALSQWPGDHADRGGRRRQAARGASPGRRRGRRGRRSRRRANRCRKSGGQRPAARRAGAAFCRTDAARRSGRRARRRHTLIAPARPSRGLRAGGTARQGCGC